VLVLVDANAEVDLVRIRIVPEGFGQTEDRIGRRHFNCFEHGRLAYG
jgi:hypothetical protein